MNGKVIYGLIILWNYGPRALGGIIRRSIIGLPRNKNMQKIMKKI